MYNTFNMGIGMIAVVPADQAAKAVELLTQAGENAYVIGSVIPGDDGVEVVY
jgi:phosphoribosylformylglycinamidine cyclo-ligase